MKFLYKLRGKEVEIDWGSLLSTAGGSSLALVLCKALIAKTLRDVEHVTHKIHEVLVHLSAINAKINEIDKINETLVLHDRAIQRIEGKLDHEHQRRLYNSNSSGMQPSESTS